MNLYIERDFFVHVFIIHYFMDLMDEIAGTQNCMGS